ncbi:hypothetical protein M011DRAFT_451233 [Sporormia fimetaria CBS 119925]|uniref:Synaptobrevin n=1 Tax=Sporormia fimetaria CBS 119925 TaxID=1340428 RepID=A0A6A6V185_9PLEO|nr:hypothetical protein M011DRAFT_451233 [Sporormia fimetaria CBS 119925]
MSLATLSPSDTIAINLNRILSRLQHALLSPESSASLRKSSLERDRVAANVEYARTLLLNLEHEAATSTANKSKKTALEADLKQKRQLIKQFTDRLFELNQLDDEVSEESAESEDEDEDRFPSYAPHVKAQGGLDVKTGSEGNEALAAAAQNLTSQLRRRGKGAEGQDEVAASGNELFAKRMGEKPTQETLLSHHRQEQENITQSLLEMAKQLKQQSVHFQETLESDKGVVDRAVQGLDKSTQSMDAAGQRINTLRRMTEGKGWWGRMKLYAFIFGLWVAAFLVVFVGPKIRF